MALSKPVHQADLSWNNELGRAELFMPVYEMRVFGACPDSTFGLKCIEFMENAHNWPCEAREDRQHWVEYEQLVGKIFDRDLCNFGGSRLNPGLPIYANFPIPSAMLLDWDVLEGLEEVLMYKVELCVHVSSPLPSFPRRVQHVIFSQAACL